jgi:hypothetical protein
MNESYTLPDGSRIVTVDNGDGTGTRTHTNPAGEVELVETLTGLPVPLPEPAPPEVTAAEVIAAEIDARLAPADVNSIAEVKAAIRQGLAAAVATLRG